MVYWSVKGENGIDKIFYLDKSVVNNIDEVLEIEYDDGDLSEFLSELSKVNNVDYMSPMYKAFYLGIASALLKKTGLDITYKPQYLSIEDMMIGLKVAVTNVGNAINRLSIDEFNSSFLTDLYINMFNDAFSSLSGSYIDYLNIDKDLKFKSLGKDVLSFKNDIRAYNLYVSMLTKFKLKLK